MRRPASRLIQRPDDREEVIGKRLEVFEAQTKPLIQHYQRCRACCGSSTPTRSVDSVFKGIQTRSASELSRRPQLRQSLQLSQSPQLSQSLQQTLADFPAPPTRNAGASR